MSYELYKNQTWWKNTSKKEAGAERELAVELGEIAYINNGKCHHTILNIPLSDLVKAMVKNNVTNIETLKQYLKKNRKSHGPTIKDHRHNLKDAFHTMAHYLGVYRGKGYDREYIKVKVDLGPDGKGGRKTRAMKYRQGEFAFNLSAIKIGRKNGYRGLKLIDFLNWAQEFHYKNRDRGEGKDRTVFDRTRLQGRTRIRYGRYFVFDKHLYHYKGEMGTRLEGRGKARKKVSRWMWDMREIVSEKLDLSIKDHTSHYWEGIRFSQKRKAAKKHWDNDIRNEVLSYFTLDDMLKKTHTSVISDFMRKARRNAKLGYGSFEYSDMMFHTRKKGPLTHGDGVTQSSDFGDRMRHKGIFKKTPFYIDWANPDVSKEQGAFEHVKDVTAVAAVCLALAQPQVGAIVKTFSRVLEKDGDLLESIYEQYNAQQDFIPSG